MKFLKQAWSLYYDGFRSMTIGRVLWAVIFVKLFIIFVVLNVFFFPDYLKKHAADDKAEFVSSQLAKPPITHNP